LSFTYNLSLLTNKRTHIKLTTAKHSVELSCSEVRLSAAIIATCQLVQQLKTSRSGVGLLPSLRVLSASRHGRRSAAELAGGYEKMTINVLLIIPSTSPRQLADVHWNFGDFLRLELLQFGSLVAVSFSANTFVSISLVLSRPY